MEIFSILSFIGVLILWHKVSTLENVIRNLRSGEQVRQDSVQKVVSPINASQIYPSGILPQVPVPGLTTPSPVVGHAPDSDVEIVTRFMQWFAKDWLVKVGGLLLLIGIGWFVTIFSVAIGMIIGPVGRVIIGLSIGVGILSVGIWRIEKYRHQGGIFTVLGSTLVLLVIYAAQNQYDLFSPLSALAIMFLSIVLVAFVSVRYHSQTLGIASVLLSGFAWFLAGGGRVVEVSALSMNLYLLVVVLGTVWVVYYTGWASVALSSLVLVSLYGLPYLTNFMNHDRDIAFLFALLFTAIFFLTNIASILYSKKDEVSGLQLITALGAGLYLMIWIGIAGIKEFQTPLYFVWMCVFALGSFLVYRRTNARTPFLVYGGLSLALLGAATATEFQGMALSIAFTIEVATLVAASVRFSLGQDAVTNTPIQKTPLVALLAWLFALPIFLSLPSLMSSQWLYGFQSDDFFVISTLIFSLVGVSGYMSLYARPYVDVVKKTGITLLMIAGMYTLALIWLVLHALFSSSAATSIALFVYTVLGLGLYISGRMQSQSLRGIVGGVLLGGVVMRLLFVDVWDMSLNVRMVTFVGIGVLLMATAFMGRSRALGTSKKI